MNNPQICSVCGVLMSSKEVRFSNGSAGTHARLYARVCQYAKKPGCINKDPDLIGEVRAEDGYGSVVLPQT